MKGFLVRFPSKVLEEIQEEARRQGVSASELVRVAVRGYLGGEEKLKGDRTSSESRLVARVKSELLADEDFLSAVRNTREDGEHDDPGSPESQGVALGR